MEMLNDHLNSEGRVVVEVFKDTVLKEEYMDLYLIKERRYGIAKLLYYGKKREIST